MPIWYGLIWPAAIGAQVSSDRNPQPPEHLPRGKCAGRSPRGSTAGNRVTQLAAQSRTQLRVTSLSGVLCRQLEGTRPSTFACDQRTAMSVERQTALLNLPPLAAFAMAPSYTFEDARHHQQHGRLKLSGQQPGS